MLSSGYSDFHSMSHANKNAAGVYSQTQFVGQMRWLPQNSGYYCRVGMHLMSLNSQKIAIPSEIDKAGKWCSKIRKCEDYNIAAFWGNVIF